MLSILLSTLIQPFSFFGLWTEQLRVPGEKLHSCDYWCHYILLLSDYSCVLIYSQYVWSTDSVILNLPFPLKSPFCHQVFSDSADDCSAISPRKTKDMKWGLYLPLPLPYKLIDICTSPSWWKRCPSKVHFQPVAWTPSLPTYTMSSLYQSSPLSSFILENKENNVLSHQKQNKKQVYCISLGFLTLSKRNKIRIIYRKSTIHWKNTDVTHSLEEDAKQPSLLRAESSGS